MRTGQNILTFQKCPRSVGKKVFSGPHYAAVQVLTHTHGRSERGQVFSSQQWINLYLLLPEGKQICINN